MQTRQGPPRNPATLHGQHKPPLLRRTPPPHATTCTIQTPLSCATIWTAGSQGSLQLSCHSPETLAAGAVGTVEAVQESLDCTLIPHRPDATHGPPVGLPCVRIAVELFGGRMGQMD